MDILNEEEEEKIEKGLRNICEVLSDRWHDVLHDRLQENVLTCRVFHQCEKCPFYNVDTFTNWMKEQDENS